MKNKLFEIYNANFGLIGPDSWTHRIWEIYDDMSGIYTIEYNSIENNKETREFALTKEEFDTIINNIELAKPDTTTVNACDGEAWKFTEYNNGEEAWKRDLGYIYGIAPLENITNILRNK